MDQYSISLINSNHTLKQCLSLHTPDLSFRGEKILHIELKPKIISDFP